jgi:hypothetical protein
MNFEPETTELKNLAINLQTKNLNSVLINLDLTSLNKKFSYEKTSQLKINLISQLNTEFKNKILFQKILGGKILIILNSKILQSNKIKIQEFCEKELNGDKQRYIYISEQTIEQNKLNLEELLKVQIQNETKLKYQRYKIQKELSNQELEYQLQQIPQINKENIKQLLNLTKESKYLTNAIYFYANSKPEQSFENCIYYKIWYEIQDLLFENYKIEKIKHNIEKRKIQIEKNKYITEEKLKIKNNVLRREFKIQIKDLKDWYLASIKTIEKFFDETQLKDSHKIEKEINYLEFSENPDLDIHIISRDISNFIKKLKIKGFQAIPLENQTPIKQAIQFIQRQTQLLQNPKNTEEWNNQTKISLQQKFRKPEYKTFVNGYSESIYQSIKYTNQYTNSKTLHFAFLEIDFFNAFNTYFFQNDTDKYYKEIIDEIFKVSNKYIYKSPQLFKTLNIGLLGDEFFFTFLSIEYLTQKEKEIIKEFLLEIEKEILEITKNKLLIKTDKKTIIDKKGNEITIRIPIIKNSNNIINKLTNTINQKTFEIGKISISKYFLQDIKIEINKLTQKEFEEKYNYISSKMDQIKKNKENKFIIETAHTL